MRSEVGWEGTITSIWRGAIVSILLLGWIQAGHAEDTPKLAAKIYEIPGGILPGRQPDGNTYVIEGKHGLTVIDTGRHPDHRLAIETLAKQLHKPIVAIINTHWHLDHVSGNPGLKATYPNAKVYASSAIDGALTGFLVDSADEARKAIDSGKLDASTVEEIRLDLATVEHGEALKPDVVVDGPRRITDGGVRLDLHLAKDAATAGDVWVFDPTSKVVFVGDLVTFPAPFLDTACGQGWISALEEVEKISFRQVAPGHGPVLTRAELERYHGAFDALLVCSKTTAKAGVCADAWVGAVADMGKMSAEDKAQAHGMTAYYVSDVLRPNGGNSKYCAKPQ